MEAIEEFTNELTFDEFIVSKKEQWAVLRAFEMIGEAVKNLSPEIKENYGQVPWKELARLRDVLNNFKKLTLFSHKIVLRN